MYHPTKVIDDIAKFTSQRDKDLLAFSLLKSLKNMVVSSKSSIISFDNIGRILSMIVYQGDTCLIKDANIEVSTELVEAINYMKAALIDKYTLKSANGYTVINVLQHDRKSEQYLVIDLANPLEKSQSYFLSGILSIYVNFTALLEESQTDELTGLANRKTFESSIANVFDEQIVSSDKIQNDRRLVVNKENAKDLRYWLVIIDIDHFKQVNDNFGHLYGDEILIKIAQLIRASFRHEDLKFRFGGEEFVVLLSIPDRAGCEYVLEKFRARVEATRFPNIEKLTVSLGVVEFKKGTFHVTSIDCADQALYYSKDNGRNKITYFEDMLASGAAKLAEIEGGDVDLF